MASNIDTIHARLAADATLVGSLGINGYSGILKGGVWVRKLKRQGPAKTEAAFYTAAEKGKMVRPACVIVDEGDVPHRQRLSIAGAYEQQIHLYLYAPATQTGKTAIHAARRRIYALIDHEMSGGWTFVTDDGPIAFVHYQSRLGIRNSEQFTDAVYDYCLYQVTSRHGSIV